jgi:hypothetical protein
MSQSITVPPPCPSANETADGHHGGVRQAGHQVGAQGERRRENVGCDRIAGDHGGVRPESRLPRLRIDEVMNESPVAVPPRTPVTARRRDTLTLREAHTSSRCTAGLERRLDIHLVVAANGDEVTPGVDQHGWVVRQDSQEIGSAAGHPPLGDATEIEPRSCGDLSPAAGAVDGDGAAHRRRSRAGGRIRCDLPETPAVAPCRKRAADQRLEHAAGVSRPSAAGIEHIQRFLRDVDGRAGRRVQAADIAVGKKTRPAMLVTGHRLGHRRRSRLMDAPAVVDVPGGAGRPPCPRAGRHVVGLGHQLVWVAGAEAVAIGAAGAGTGAVGTCTGCRLESSRRCDWRVLTTRALYRRARAR